MSSRRRTIWISLPVTLATLALAPIAAWGNPLLSGYGGPGQGDQAVLGATLLNTPKGGGGSSSSGGGAAGTSAAALTVQSGSAASGGAPHARKGTRHPAAARAHAGTKAVSHPTAPSGGSVDEVAATANSSGGTLGLSGGDLAYLLLALAALAAAGVLTRQLSRRSH